MNYLLCNTELFAILRDVPKSILPRVDPRSFPRFLDIAEIISDCVNVKEPFFSRSINKSRINLSILLIINK